MRALVTGAGHGLGRALSEELLDQGYELVLVDRDAEALNKITAAHQRGACTPRIVNLINFDAVQMLLRHLDGQKFDLVILNAGISATGKFEEIPADVYDKVIAVNLGAPLHLASHLVDGGHMAHESKIVFISSLSHAVGYPGGSVYAATKDAVAAYARCVTKPFKKKKVKVLTVFPGPIKTDHAELHAPEDSDASKRMEPQKMARLILKAAKRGTKIYYPGTKAYLAAILGKTFPVFATRVMRRNLLDKMKGPTY